MKKGNFLNVNYNVEYEIISIKFMCSIAFQSASLPYALNGSFTHA